MQEEYETLIDDTVNFLSAKTNELNRLVVEYVEICKGEDQLEARRKLKAIQQLGLELARVNTH